MKTKVMRYRMIRRKVGRKRKKKGPVGRKRGRIKKEVLKEVIK